MSARNSNTLPDNGSPQAAMIAAGVLAAYAAEGYLTADGTSKDNAKVRSVIMEVVRTHKVIQWKDRQANAIKRGEVVRQVFPGLPAPPDGFSETDDPQLAKAVWGKIYSEVWSHLTVGANSALQQLIGATMGNGYVLCRTTLDSPTPDAVYVTDNRVCIERDMLEPENDSVTRKIEAMIATRTMLIMRQPENSRRYAKGGNDVLKLLQVTGHDRLAIAVEASNSAGTADESGEPGEPDES